MVQFVRDLEVSTARGDRFSAYWSEIPATADSFVSLSTDSLLPFWRSLVIENFELFLLLVGETDSFY